MKGAGARRGAVAGAAIAFVCVVGALVVLSVAAYAHRLRDTGAELARTLPQRYDIARSRYPSPGATLAALSGIPVAGWRVRLQNAQTPDAAPPLGGALAARLGIVPKRIPLDDATLEIVPDFGALAHAGELEGLALLTVFAFGFAALWRFADAPARITGQVYEPREGRRPPLS